MSGFNKLTNSRFISRRNNRESVENKRNRLSNKRLTFSLHERIEIMSCIDRHKLWVWEKTFLHGSLKFGCSKIGFNYNKFNIQIFLL